MRSFNILPLALCATTTLAFPTLDVETRQLPVGFDEKAQRISVSGKHKFVAPDFSKGDQRGPCSGLNALANHGYLPHSGVGTIADFIEATGTVFGLGRDVAAAVAVYGAIFDGDGLSWSIGGPPPNHGLSGLNPNLLGTPKGISFSHNNYEGDASATRYDLYAAGNDFKVDMDAFKELDNALPAKSFSVLVNHRNQRVQHSVHTNPYYFSGPFTGIAVSGGANAFVYRLAANHSKEYPNGILDKNTFRSIWSVKEKGGELYWEPGHDRIPENWYRRSLLEPYDFGLLGLDLATYFAAHPDTVKVGGNLGKVNTFTGLDLANVTGGVFNAEELGQGNNAACFAFQAATIGAPDLLSKIFKDISGPLAMLTDAFEPLIAKAECKRLNKFDNKALAKYPGYSKKYGYYQGTGDE